MGMGLGNSSKSKLLKNVLLSCAGLSLIISLSFVFTEISISIQEQSSCDLVKGNGNGLLKSSPNEGGFWRENDLTIVGHRSLKATKEDEEREKIEEEENRKNPVIRISHQGRVRGTVLKSREGRDYFAFYQVPYARPPLGKLRFAVPEEPRRWWGIRDGTIPGAQCLQRDNYSTQPNSTSGSEDCLHLNIYTPKLPQSMSGKNDKLLPVMFYIHGGSAGGNGTRYGAKYFMDEDVVLITVEFRIGMFGVFTTGTKEFPGNLDSRDQVQALKWVQKNIQRFGGDPKKVLVFGNSSGSSYVHAHIISPMSKGLFHRAIMQSGNCIRVDQLIQNHYDKIITFIEEIGCRDSNHSLTATIDCLRKSDANSIALSSQALVAGFVEETYEDDHANKFLPSAPWNLVESGTVANPDIPVIIGVNSNEMMNNDKINPLFLTENGTKILNQRFDEILSSKEPGLEKKFRQVYFDSKDISYDNRMGMWDFLSDLAFHSHRVAGMTLTNSTRQPVYFYLLTKEPEKSYADRTKQMFPPPYGVAHSDELQYLFNYKNFPEITKDSKWFDISRNMIKMWTSFARDGKPEIKNLPGNVQNIEWDPILLEDRGMEWLQLDDEIKYVQPFTERMELWDEYNEELFEQYPYLPMTPFAQFVQNTLNGFIV